MSVNNSIIRVDGIYKTFATPEGPHVALKDVSFEIAAGEVVAIVGPSGSGKSTLLRTLNALETIDSGRIEICDQRYDTSGTKAHVLRRQTAMIFQRFELFPHYTVLGNVTLALEQVQKKTKEQAVAIATDLLFRVGLSHHLNKYPRALSGGQQQRVAIARALAMEPRVLLCDEPTSALDPELVHEVLEILLAIAKNRMTMLIVTHSLGFARKIATRCLFMDAGELVESQPTEAFFEDPKSDRLKTFLSRVRAAY